METFAVVMAMLVAVMLSGMIVRVLPIPVPAPFVQIALGFIIAAVFQRGVLMEPEIFFLLFLPPLLFLDGWRVSKRSVLGESSLILQLSIGLVFLTVVGVGYLIHWMIPSVPLAVAFAIAAIVSPTDPVAVAAISKRVHIPHRMMAILEGESLFNDASGLVAFRFAVAAAVTGAFSLWQATVSFFWMALAGIAIGVGATAILLVLKGKFRRRFGVEPGSDMLLSLIIPFIVYFIAEHARASGILAAVAAGITMSYLEMAGGLSAQARIERQTVWTTVQLTLNGVMFVLLGEQLPIILDRLDDAAQESGQDHLFWLPVYAAAIWLGLMLVRLIWVALSIKISEAVARRRGLVPLKVSPRMILAMAMAGVRGAVTLAGVMTLPLALPDGSAFPSRELAICLATFVLLISLLMANFSLPKLLGGVGASADDGTHVDQTLARQAMLDAALESVVKTRERLTSDHPDNAELYLSAAERLSEALRDRADIHLSEPRDEQRAHQHSVERQMRLEAIAASRRAIYRLALRHRISDTFAREQVKLLDMQEAHLRAED
ncbi:Na+/H+ antiporter [Bordetella sp. 15P40C-2]|uniref:Na+/H+ antiporter n=1 Tax=Bordetella sp. 15P40C-2 TaxID=2572246 RepID=UPI0013223C93|nr:Na+/H+ antiporter [Bordetella sp. 15P40C-2]MVW71962.1 Na+/H+ antiporter [Bordetella sp. 15P40C-2]